MRTITAQCHACRRDRVRRGHRVAFNARNLHQPAHRVTGQPQVMLHRNLCGVFNLLVRTAQNLSKTGGGHRAGAADLSLASHLGTGNRGTLLIQHPDCGGGQEKVDHRILTLAPTAMPYSGRIVHRIVQNRRNNAGCTIRRRRHHAAAKRILFVHGERD